MPRSINHQQSGYFHLNWVKILNFLDFGFYLFSWEESGSDLLGDSAGLAFLNVRVTDSVQKGGFSSVHVTQDADDG